MRREDVSAEWGDCHSVLTHGEFSLSETVDNLRDHLHLPDSVSSEFR